MMKLLKKQPLKPNWRTKCTHLKLTKPILAHSFLTQTQKWNLKLSKELAGSPVPAAILDPSGLQTGLIESNELMRLYSRPEFNSRILIGPCH